MSPRELLTARLEALARALGAGELLAPALAGAHTLTQGWGEAPLERLDRSPVRLMADGCPLELSVAFEPRGVALRALVEQQSGTGDAREQWAAADRATDALVARHGAVRTRLDRIADLFRPAAGPVRTWSMWHAFSAEPDRSLVWKVYVNPAVHGAEARAELMAAALDRLDMAAAWRFTSALIERCAEPVELAYLSLDLDGGPRARIKVYLEHTTACVEDIELALASSPRHRTGDAGRLFARLAPSGERHARQMPFTTLAFTAGSPQPDSVTLHIPVRAHVRDDREALRRVLAAVAEADRAPIRQAVAAMAARPLETGVGLIQFLSTRRTADGQRATLYLAAEPFGPQPAR